MIKKSEQNQYVVIFIQKKEFLVIFNLLEKLNESDLENVNLYYILRNKRGENLTYKVLWYKN